MGLAWNNGTLVGNNGTQGELGEDNGTRPRWETRTQGEISEGNEMGIEGDIGTLDGIVDINETS